jgi:hypothetical protein
MDLAARLYDRNIPVLYIAWRHLAATNFHTQLVWPGPIYSVSKCRGLCQWLPLRYANALAYYRRSRDPFQFRFRISLTSSSSSHPISNPNMANTTTDDAILSIEAPIQLPVQRSRCISWSQSPGQPLAPSPRQRLVIIVARNRSSIEFSAYSTFCFEPYTKYYITQKVSTPNSGRSPCSYETMLRASLGLPARQYYPFLGPY